jgi:hypothetical protein
VLRLGLGVWIVVVWLMFEGFEVGLGRLILGV